MPSYQPSYMYRRRGTSLKAGALRQRATTAIAARVRDAMSQAGRGRPVARPGQASRTTMPVASASRVGTAVATQMTTRRRPTRSTKDYRAKARPLTASTPSSILRGSIKTIPQIFQHMNEVELGYGAQTLPNVAGANNYMPCICYALTTIDRPNADLGTVNPAHLLQRDSSFIQFGNPMVFSSTTGIANGNPDPFASASKLFLDSIKIRMLLWGRVHKETTYQIQVFRFKKEGYHINPYTTPAEDTSLSLLSAEQLSERKAFWFDFMMRKHTVNPVAISQNIGARFSKYIEVVYDKKVTIAETESTMDEGNKQLITASLPIRRFVNFNHDVNTRYDENTDAERTDTPINTITNDMADTKFYHKARMNHNYWLCVRANNTILTGTGGEDTTAGHDQGPWVPTYDLSFQCNYKVLDAH